MTVMNTNYCTIDEAWGDLTAKPKKDTNKKKKIVPPNDPICDLYEAKSNSTSYNETDLVRFANEYYDKYDKSKYQRNMRTQSMASEEVDREISPKTLVINKDQSKYEVTSENKRNPNTALFEKQFEMSLPPMYDGGECPLIKGNTKTNDEWMGDNSVAHYNTVQEEQPRYKPQPQAQAGVYGESDDEEHEIEMESQSRHSRQSRQHIYDEGDDYQQKPRHRYSPQERVSYSEQERNRYFDDYDDSSNYQKMKTKYNSIQIFDLILYVVSGIILIFLLEQFVRIGINMQGSM